MTIIIKRHAEPNSASGPPPGALPFARHILIAVLTTALLLAPAAFAADDVVEHEFTRLSQLGNIKKPTVKIQTTKDAFDFILADSIVRKGVMDSMAQGYEDWKATAKLMGYDGDEPVYEVRVTSMSQLPPYSCVFRFDSIGNDRREQPWNGCQYE